METSGRVAALMETLRSPVALVKEELASELATLRVRVRSIEKELSDLGRIEVALKSSAPTQKRTRAKRGEGGERTKISEARYGELLAHLRANYPDVSFAINAVAQELGWHPTSVNSGVRRGRDEQIIRKAGKEGRTFVYRLMEGS